MVASTWVGNAVHLGHGVNEDVKETLVREGGRVGQVLEVYQVCRGESVLRGKPVLKESLALKDLLVYKVVVGGQVCLVLKARLVETGSMEHKDHEATVGHEGTEVDGAGEAYEVKEAGRARQGHRVRKEIRAIEGHRAEED